MKQRSIANFFAPKPSKQPSPSSAKKRAANGLKKQENTDILKKPEIAAPAGPAAPKLPTKDLQQPSCKRPSPADSDGSKENAAVDASKPAPDQHQLGQRISIYWQDDDAWYDGTIKEYDGKSKHKVLYDDGEVEWVALANEQTRPAADRPAKRLRRLRPAVLMSASESAGSGQKLEDADSDADFVANAADDASQGDGSDAEGSVMEEDEPEESGGSGAVAAKRKRSGSKVAQSSRKQPRTAAKTPAAKARAAAAATPAPGPRGKSGAIAAATPGTGPGGATSGRVTTPGTAATPAAVMTATVTPGTTTPYSRAGTATPSTAARGSMHSGLGLTPSTATKEAAQDVVFGLQVGASGSGDGERFLARMAQRFPFLHPDRIKDAKKRPRSDPDYDPRTLYVPEGWFKEAKVSEGQQQWWQFKALNFDSVLLFKMGKFYELFEMDAYVGVDILGLQFMKGEQPHAGFPEAVYHQMAEALARAGHRVVVVEQTETPEQLAKRNEGRKKGVAQAKVVMREKVAVLTRGTMLDAEMVSSHPDAAYVLALHEAPCAPRAAGAEAEEGKEVPEVVIGVCFADVASGQLVVGQFEDGAGRARLRSHLAAMTPVEVVLPRGVTSGTTLGVLRNALREPRVGEMRDEAADWSSERTLADLSSGEYFAKSNAQAGAAPEALPQVLAALAADPGANCAALSALGGMILFLRESLLDKAVLPLGRVEALPGGSAEDGLRGGEGISHMMLSGSALENLEVVQNSEGGSSGTLLAAVDFCTTPFGRRRLRQWLCQPLYRIADLEARQDAVADLMGPAAEAVAAAKKRLAGVSDAERAVARLHASTAGGLGREAPNVVLYEDTAKRRVKAVSSAIADLQAIAKAVKEFQEVELGSALLQRLLGPDAGWAEVDASLSDLVNATDWKEAEATGRVVAAVGTDPRYDAATASVESAKGGLAAHLREVKAKLGGGEVTYVSVGKESHLIEVPESKEKSVPPSFDLVAQRKGYKRYSSARLRELVAVLDEAEEELEAARGNALQVLIHKFVERKELWMTAIEAVAQLDALMSLATAAINNAGSMCRPQFVEPQDGQQAVFEAVQLRHPASIPIAGGSFVPNDIMLGGGGGHPRFLLLTGPNMGGKSTLLRQTCLAALLAQVGGCIPATSLKLTPFDAVFVRMGARDAIVAGQSTFFVELAETSAMLARAGPRSLVALDELGRGTATSDGAAIAGAVTGHVVHTTRCLGLFATHYHQLVHDHEADPAVGIMHMACAVTPAVAGRPEEVAFLYRLTSGACPKSYGTNVARLAGLPHSVVARAAEMSATRETDGPSGKTAASAVPSAQDALREAAAAAVRALRALAAGDAAVVEGLGAVQERAACAAVEMMC